MQDMLDNAKRAAGAMMGRAAWEADRTQRISGLQRELALLQRERTALLDQLAAAVLDLARRGEITHTGLKAIGDRMVGLEDEVKRAQAAIRTIQDEKYQGGNAPYSVGPVGPGGPERACRSCGSRMPAGARFCSSCGARLA